MKPRLLMAFFLIAVFNSQVFAQFTTFAAPTTGYTSGTTLLSIPGANFSTTTSLTNGTETLGFSSTLDVRTVPGGGWATWNSPPATESATPKVLAGVGLTSLTITLTPAVNTFGFEIEPNNGTQTVTATYYNGATVLGTISQSIAGTSGALLAAASATTPITSVVITVPPAATGFAMAQFRYGGFLGSTGVPALGTPGLSALALALIAAGSLVARRNQANQV